MVEYGKKITNEELEHYFNKECPNGIKDFAKCNNRNCSLFITPRNECVFIADEKLEQWQKEQHKKFNEKLKMYG